jgi:iron complex outermembrane receptor protein
MGKNFTGLRQLRAVLLGCAAAWALADSACAQDAPRANSQLDEEAAIALGPVEVQGTVSRLRPRIARQPARERAPLPVPRPTRGQATAAPSNTPAQAGPAETGGGLALPSGILSGTIITGASSTVITAAEIERAPEHSLQDILSREPGVQVTNLFGGVNGARSQIDMRGFGAAAASNTLVLINGRRITDLDMVGFDLASIPRESIERIEITRGGSGAVLYGDGVQGGVINIVTKTGVDVKPQAATDVTVGSFKYRAANARMQTSNGPWAVSLFSNGINSDGYRNNNFYRQVNAIGDFRYTANEGSAYLNLSTDTSYIGLPGARRVDPVIGMNQLISDPQGATTPYDWAQKRGKNATLGFTRLLAPGIEAIVDGGIRNKNEVAAFHYVNAAFESPPFFGIGRPIRAVDTTLTTTSFTPRLKVDMPFANLGLQVRAIGGFDYYDAQYYSERPQFLGAPPIHVYNLSQKTLAGYWQQTITLPTNTDVGFGGRIQGHSVYATDAFNANAPGGTDCFLGYGCFPSDVQGLPYNDWENNRAYHLGFEHRFNSHFLVFGRTAQSFRVPNVDERVGTAPIRGSDPTTFNLRTQKSHDFEIGFRYRAGPLDVQWSRYDMYLVDEIHFRFAPGFIANNINLDPTRRYGHETILGYAPTDYLRFKGGLAYTRAVFREGPFVGNDVPLVSRWTGSLGATWNIVPEWLTFDGVVRYIGTRRMDNDQRNLQPLIPAHTLVDVGLNGKVDRFYWSLKVQNLFNVYYFDYAIASPFPDGPGSQLNTYNAYPQPGRTYLAKAGVQW